MTHTPWGEIGDFCSDTNTYHVGKFRRWMYYVFNTRSTHGKMLYAPSGDAEYSPRASERYLGNLCTDISNLKDLVAAKFVFEKDCIGVSFFKPNFFEGLMREMNEKDRNIWINMTNRGPFVLWSSTPLMDKFRDKLVELGNTIGPRSAIHLIDIFDQVYSNCTDHITNRDTPDVEYLLGETK